MWDNAPNKPTKFRIKNAVEINGDSHGTYNNNSQITFKTSMLKSSLCNYSNASILVSGTIRITGTGADDAGKQLDERNKRVKFKNCAPFKSEISITQIDNAKYVDVVIPMYNLI